MSEPARTIATLLERHARTRPGAAFCTFYHGGGSSEISFGDLFERSAAYAALYAELGVRPGDLVLVILQHTPHLFYSYLGAILAGAVPSFMPFPSPKQRPDIYWHDHDALFKRIEPRAIVTYEENLRAARRTLPDFAIDAVIADEQILQKAPPAELAGLRAEPNAVACLQHSSGTTGLKKGVMLTHRAIADEVDAYARAIGFTRNDRIASWLPLYHDMGFIGCFMTSVVLGTHLVALDPFEWVMRPTLLLDAIERHRTTFTWLPNFAFSHIVNGARSGKRWDLSSVRAFINCSEPCKAATFERFFERFRGSGVTRQALHVCYAMAENVFAVTQTPLGESAKVLPLDADAFARGQAVTASSPDALRLLSCGPAIDGVRIEILGEDGLLAPPGRIGEIRLRSPFMFDGYYKLPEKTDERLSGGWYRTGDMGFIHEGELYVTGRMDDMLIVNGRNYYAHEIEAIANEVSGAIPGRNVAIGVNDERTDATAVVILAECRPDADSLAVATEIKRLVLESLGLAVHSVVPLQSGEMVKTTSGKISRSKNKDLYQNGTFTARRHAGQDQSAARKFGG